MKRHHLLALGLPTAVALGSYVGCTAQSREWESGTGTPTGDHGIGGSGGTMGSGGGGTGGTSAGGAGTGGMAAAGGNDTPLGGNLPYDASFDANFSYDAPPFDSSLNEDSACAEITVAAEPIPLDIYFMLDASTSMSQPYGYGDDGDCNANYPSWSPTIDSKWCRAVNSIAGYVSSLQAAGNQAALQFFQVYSGHNCNGTPYAVPSVDLGLLPGSYSGHALTLITGLNGAYPWDATPTEGALRGLTMFTASHVTAGREIIGILVTDGVPSSCNTSDSTLAGIVQNHYTNTGIHTFIVGMTGANFTRLEDWANYPGAIAHDDMGNDYCGNGGGPCYHWNVGDGNPSTFIEALNLIQNAVVGCTFAMPELPDGGVLDIDVVQVNYYEGGTIKHELTRVGPGTALSCTSGYQWSYDQVPNPTSITLCPDMCATVQADPDAEIEILLGCQGS